MYSRYYRLLSSPAADILLVKCVVTGVHVLLVVITDCLPCQASPRGPYFSVEGRGGQAASILWPDKLFVAGVKPYIEEGYLLKTEDHVVIPKVQDAKGDI